MWTRWGRRIIKSDDKFCKDPIKLEVILTLTQKVADELVEHSYGDSETSQLQPPIADSDQSSGASTDQAMNVVLSNDNTKSYSERVSVSNQMDEGSTGWARPRAHISHGQTTSHLNSETCK